MIKSFKHGLAEHERVIIEDMTLSELADRLHCSVNGLIVEFLTRGIIAHKNQVVKKQQIVFVLDALEIPHQDRVDNNELTLERVIEVKASHGEELRLPVVAVIGHVNHGKTSFLDYIRKAKVAEKEKGGITQHVAAYEVHTKHGNLVFLDTPGHEAFSMMRERGVLIADLVILVVALDDGIKPQTVESIKKIKEFGAVTVVALNKVDKVKPDRIDIVKKQLADHGLVADDWGGDIAMSPISAKTGQGIDELLEIVRLQADILDLRTSSKSEAQGVVLESMIEHGRGSVATVILHKGTLRVGDHFSCGTTYGRVSSMYNAFGKKVQSVGPSIPVIIAGFDELPEAGSVFKIISAADIKKIKQGKSQQKATSTGGYLHANSDSDDAIHIIVKAGTLLSKEALLVSLRKLSERYHNRIKIIDAGIGDINENNLELAATTSALVYGLDVKMQKTLLNAMKKPVEVKLFDIIYQLLEDVEKVIVSRAKKVIEEKELGRARVKAIFRIKSIGVIAGAEVKSGMLQKGAKVKIYRDSAVIGSGTIKTLQREKSTVPSVQAGHDCAFAVDTFSNWKIGDEIYCYTEVVVE